MTTTEQQQQPAPAGDKIFNIKDKVILTQVQLDYINHKLADLSPQQILKWAIVTFPNLYQTTAFGLTGLVTIDILSKMNTSTELIFLDTLHHFPQTVDLVQRVQEKYPHNKVNIYQPMGVSTEMEFEEKYGKQLWETDEDKYDFLVKVEPAQRAYKELGVVAVFTGRRRSQGGARNSLQILEIDEASNIIKINPMANWSFSQVLSYIKEHDVPYNELLDLGYRSVGDYHSTVPVAEGEDERAGRWKGRVKSECGIHETSKFAQYLKQHEAVKALD
jgi:phosphoadenosine phosphosulfate reductase